MCIICKICLPFTEHLKKFWNAFKAKLLIDLLRHNISNNDFIYNLLTTGQKNIVIRLSPIMLRNEMLFHLIKTNVNNGSTIINANFRHLLGNNEHYKELKMLWEKISE